MKKEITKLYVADEIRKLNDKYPNSIEGAMEFRIALLEWAQEIFQNEIDKLKDQ